MNLNKVFLAGRLTADPQLRTTPTGRQVVNFSIATNRIWTGSNSQRQEATEYHNVVVWDRQAEVVSRFLTKGSLVLVEGRLQTRVWDDRQGQKRRTTEIVAERVQFGPRTSGPGASAPFGGGASVASVAGGSAPPVEEIPTVNLDESLPEEIKAEDLPF